MRPAWSWYVSLEYGSAFSGQLEADWEHEDRMDVVPPHSLPARNQSTQTPRTWRGHRDRQARALSVLGVRGHSLADEARAGHWPSTHTHTPQGTSPHPRFQ